MVSHYFITQDQMLALADAAASRTAYRCSAAVTNTHARTTWRCLLDTLCPCKGSIKTADVSKISAWTTTTKHTLTGRMAVEINLGKQALLNLLSTLLIRMDPLIPGMSNFLDQLATVCLVSTIRTLSIEEG